MLFHINNFSKKRGIGKKLLRTFRAVILEEHEDLVAGDFQRRRLEPPTQYQASQYYRRSFRRRRFTDAPHTVVGPKCNTK